MSLRFRTCDVFTEEAYSGNPLAVVYGADDLPTAVMQRIAREFALSETIFIQEPDAVTSTAKVRIFTPTSELPFAGHPTIGCAILLAEESAGDGGFSTVIVLEEKAGTVPVSVMRKDDRISATLTAPVVPVAEGVPVTPAMAADALGISEADIGFDAHKIGRAAAGPHFLFVPVNSLDALKRVSTRSSAFSDLEEIGGATEIYVYAPDPKGSDFQARMFAPSIGIPEDPATGAATVCLAAHLDACGLIQDGTTGFAIHQGVEMGRPSRLTLEIDRQDGALVAVRVSGSAVGIMEGTLEPPA